MRPYCHAVTKYALWLYIYLSLQLKLEEERLTFGTSPLLACRPASHLTQRENREQVHTSQGTAYDLHGIMCPGEATRS